MQVIKCDITSKMDVPMVKTVKVNEITGGESMLLDGERLNYTIFITNENGYQAKDVAEEYVLAEMIGLMTKRLNEIRNPSVNQTEQNDPSSDIKVIGGER